MVHDLPKTISRARELVVPENVGGMRLDRFLALWFANWSRTRLVRGIKGGLVLDNRGKPLKASNTVLHGDRLTLLIPGLAPTTDPPPFPPIVFEDDRLLIINKPAGLLAHPAGNEFTWSVIGLAKEKWPNETLDLVHRIDRETSGLLVLTKDIAANRYIKARFQSGETQKDYYALCRGVIDWESKLIEAPIGHKNGPIRIQMGVAPDGQPSRTEVKVLDRLAPTPGAPMGFTQVQCRIGTGRTHQIRVHLDHAGFSVVGDRMYGVSPEVFLDYWDHGLSEATLVAAGAPRHALHAWRLSIPHPSGPPVNVEAPLPADLVRWWHQPSVLPLDGWTPSDEGPKEEQEG